MKHYDLYADGRCADAYRRLGWDGFCVTVGYGTDYRRLQDGARRLGGDVSVGAVLTKDVEKDAKKAIDLGADLVIVDGRTDEPARAASESWDVDLIVNPELNEERDLVDQWSSGLDHIMSSFMAERDIGYLVNCGNLLHSSGLRRTRLIGRIMQNLRLAKKYGFKVVVSSGSRTPQDARNPSDLTQVAMMLGMDEDAAENATSKNTEHFMKKSHDRNSGDVLMRGLSVKSWGAAERRPKRKHGWY